VSLIPALVGVLTIVTLVVGWTAVSATVTHGLGRRCDREPASRAAVALGEAALFATALLPLGAVLALASLVVHARLVSGEWPHLGPPRWVGGWDPWVRDGFHVTRLSAHRAVVTWTWLLALVSPLLYVLPQGLLVGLGRLPRRRLLTWHVASWLAWLVLAAVDPGGFVDWISDRCR
jgi:hypothetical protein